MVAKILQSVACILVVIGAGIEWKAHSRPANLKVAPDPRAVIDADAAKNSDAKRAHYQPGFEFDIDVGQLIGKLDALAEDERPEQFADWAAYGTLLRAGQPEGQALNAVYDKLPFRLREFRESVMVETGPGRRLLLGDGQVWFFHSARDPAPTATIARLADQVRMETGEIPKKCTLFVYSSDMPKGLIRVACKAEFTGDMLFTAKYGYVERAIG